MFADASLVPLSVWVCSEDMSAPESIELLTKSGIDFKRHEEHGIDLEYFGELLITSGLVLFDDVKWVSFHRSARASLTLSYAVAQHSTGERQHHRTKLTV